MVGREKELKIRFVPGRCELVEVRGAACRRGSCRRVGLRGPWGSEGWGPRGRGAAPRGAGCRAGPPWSLLEPRPGCAAGPKRAASGVGRLRTGATPLPERLCSAAPNDVRESPKRYNRPTSAAPSAPRRPTYPGEALGCSSAYRCSRGRLTAGGAHRVQPGAAQLAPFDARLRRSGRRYRTAPPAALPTACPGPPCGSVRAGRCGGGVPAAPSGAAAAALSGAAGRLQGGCPPRAARPSRVCFVALNVNKNINSWPRAGCSSSPRTRSIL